MDSPETEILVSWQAARTYHEATKHHFSRYARSPGHLDWATQPNPFRRYFAAGGSQVMLPLAPIDQTPPYDALYSLAPRSPRVRSRESLGEFLEYSLAITAWKSFRGNTWALRANPSSGNLHPTEGYLVLPAVEGIGSQPGVYHYVPEDHSLERRTEFAPEVYERLTSALPPGSFLAGLSSIHWREAWKYGERAYRYCQHDLGHALACLRLSAAALGWRLWLIDGLADAAVARLLGLDRTADFPPAEREEPAMVAVVSPSAADFQPAESVAGFQLAEAAIEAIAAGAWHGRATRLSPSHVAWEIIGRTSQSCIKPATPAAMPRGEPHHVEFSAAPRDSSPTAASIFRKRRSCLALDGRTTISRNTFYGMLSRVMPHPRVVPWDAVPWGPCVDLLLFVHRVGDLPPGHYALVRRPDGLAALRQSLHQDFLWCPPERCPDHLPLYFLSPGDVRQLATRVSCHQDIAGDGAFSLGMLADWEAAGDHRGAWFYRRLFWETGVIGQVLYLEAEAASIRGTGIGCFFDDAVHEAFGIRGKRFQSMYHFTLGGPVEDQRLTTLPAYGAERESES